MNAIIKFLLSSLLFVGLLVAGYFGVTAWWNTGVKQSPEYRLVDVFQALQACDVPQLKQALDLDAVVKQQAEAQVKTELESKSMLMRGILSSAALAPIVNAQIKEATHTVEKDLAQCKFFNLKTNELPFWVAPSLSGLVVVRSLLGVVSFKHSKITEDKQQASFTLHFNIKELKDADIQFKLVKKTEVTDPTQNPWLITSITPNEALLKTVFVSQPTSTT
jgi:hypothetical protein